MTEKILTCAECDELFPDYFEGELDNARRSMVEAHAATCARCQGLVRDITGITEAAANLPELVPSRDLWKGIESRIEPAVVPISYRREGIHVSRRVIGIAAALLVVISSSITYVATTRGSKRPVRVVTNPSQEFVPIAPEVGAPAPAAIESTPEPAPSVETSKAPRVTSPAPQVRRPNLGNTSAGSSGNALASNAPKTAAEAALAPEIVQLQQMLKQRRNQLDPSTVKVVEDNLALIDAAVKQARAALMRDPASGFLTEQLDNALQKKLELLRTVALLPSRS
jgi:hypothetical protein